jgi:UDP-2,3-diacylglucosamine pyrophosphatase LpxH
LERAAAHSGRKRGLDGVVCGHIHGAGIHILGEARYCSDADWVDSCSAPILERSGELELWHWKDSSGELASFERAPAIPRPR